MRLKQQKVHFKLRSGIHQLHHTVTPCNYTNDHWGTADPWLRITALEETALSYFIYITTYYPLLIFHHMSQNTVRSI